MALVREAISRLSLADKYANLNAFTYRLPSNVILDSVRHSQAAASTSPLQGKLIAVKANFSVKDWPSDACSKALSNYKAPYDSTVAVRLKSDGAVLVGLTNMDEFGMGSTGESSYHGPTNNPYGSHLSCGGSSSGSAVAVATGSVFSAIGSDTGGSVRLPASHCGVVGMKPTRGTISRHGLIAYASSLDVPGIIAQKVRDVSIVLDSIAGSDEKNDLTCRKPWKAIDWSRTSPFSGIRVGLVKEFYHKDLSESVVNIWRKGADLLLGHGMEILGNLSIPTIPDSLSAYYVIALAEASSNLARYDGVRYGYRATNNASLDLQQEYAKTRTESFGDEVQRLIIMGSLALTRRHLGNNLDEQTSYYDLASGVRQKLCQDFDRVFDQVDLLLLPTAPWPPIKKKNVAFNVTQGYVEDTMTVPASLAGLPAISVPAGICTSSGAPIGLQIIGRFDEDELVIRAAEALEHGLAFPSLFNLSKDM
jgi:aspartyl-tRNA(Asn)/glutamyl-tRNA(Gln) amidotransferase subunit A